MITMYMWREWRLARPLLCGAAALLVMAAVAAAFDVPRGMRYLAIYPDYFAVFGMLIGIVLLAGTTLVEGRHGNGGSFVARMPVALGPMLRANVLVTVAAIACTTALGALLREMLVAAFANDPGPVWAVHRLLTGALPWLCIAFLPWLLCAGGLAPQAIGVIPIGAVLVSIVVTPALALQSIVGLPLIQAGDAPGLSLWTAICGLVATAFVQRDRFRVANPWWKALGVAAFAAVPLFGFGVWRANDFATLDPRDPRTRIWDLRQTENPDVIVVQLRRFVANRVELFQRGSVDLRSGVFSAVGMAEPHPASEPLPSEHHRLAMDDGVPAPSTHGFSRFVGNAHRIWSPRRQDPRWQYFDLTRRRVLASPFASTWPLRGEWVVDTADRGADRYRRFDPETGALGAVVQLLDGERIECVLDADRVVVFRRGERALTALDPVTGQRTTLTFTGPSPEQFVTHVEVVHRTPSGAFVLRIGFERRVLFARVDGDTLVSTAPLTSVEDVTGIGDRELIASENGKVFRLTFGSDAKELVFPR